MEKCKASRFFLVLIFGFVATANAQVFIASDTGIKFISESDSNDVEKINFLGKKNSVKYIPAVLENGKKIKVPIVNELIPTIELHAFNDGSFLRVYHYDKRNRHSGEIMLKFKTINSRSGVFDIFPSLESENVVFQEAVPATGLTN